jgi:hypothetical protein
MLYYISEDCGIVAIEVTNDFDVRPGWPTKGHSGFGVARWALPLRVHDELLFGGGILGLEFFVLEPDPMKPPLLTRSSINATFTSYTVCTTEQLVFVSEPRYSHLVSYAAQSNPRDRWGEHRLSGIGAYTAVWENLESGTRERQPTLVLEIGADAEALPSGIPVGDRIGPPGMRGIRFVALLANTVELEAPEYMSTYRPTAAVLAQGLVAGPVSSPTSIVRIRAQPIISQQTLYCVAQSDTGDGPRDVVVAYSLAALWTDIAPKAVETLKTLWAQTRAIRVVISKRVYQRRGERTSEPAEWPSTGPYTVSNATVTLAMSTGARVVARTDGNGIAFVDSAFNGCTAVVADVSKSGSTVITQGKQSALEFYTW